MNYEKYLEYPIVLFLLFETACNSPSQSIKNTDLVAEDSICFPIDEIHTMQVNPYSI